MPHPATFAPAAVLVAAALLATGCAPRGDTVRAANGPLYFGDVTPPRANVLRFNNGAEPETIDPGLATGQPDGRMVRTLFEGLTVSDPRTLEPLPGQARRWERSADGLTYTFHLRSGLEWSDGTPLTARDFVWSWLRVLRPETGAKYGGLLHPVAGAEAFNRGELKDETKVGLVAPDESTLVVRLAQPTPYFLHLTSLPPCLPAPRHVVERWKETWTRPGHIVSNGAFVLATWRQNDRFELVRNPRYWDAGHVRLDRVTAYSIEDLNTATNLYKAGALDWNTSGYVPSPFIPYLRAYSDFRSGPYQAVYFYSISVTRPPFDDVWVRRALNYAVDRDAIAHDLLKRTREPWGNMTPRGYPGYQRPPGLRYDPEKARACLARAGYPGGKGFRRIAILFNTSEDHRRIAEAIQAMWTRVLGIPVELQNMEWGSYMQASTALQYDVARRSWIGDYLDPGTFLEIMRTGDGNNRTGWRDPRYDRLLRDASVELDPAKRMRLLAAAESLLLADGPVIPIYHYATAELVKPYVRGVYQNALDTHPIKDIWIDRGWRRGAPPVAGRAGPEARRSSAAGVAATQPGFAGAPPAGRPRSRRAADDPPGPASR